MMLSEPGARQPSAEVPELMVRQQVDRILSDRLFQRSDRLSRFLRYVVEQALEGTAGELKEQVLAAELYARLDGFDPTADPIVRVDARRLRDKLREYYAEFPNEPVLITVPKGSYAPKFKWNASVAPPDAARPSAAGTEARRYGQRLWFPALAVAAVGILGTVAVLWKTPSRGTPAVRLTPLTAYPGEEFGPALSPDGNFVAFSRTPLGPPGPPDIYVKAVDSEAFHRITQTPVGEYSPTWSPDGKEIAFVRALRSREMGVFVIARVGGAERKISDTGTLVVWAPDGRSVVIRDRPGDEADSLFRIDLDTLRRRRLTHSPPGFTDGRFDISPDGKRVAFIRRDDAGVGSIYVVGMDGGEPRKLIHARAALQDVGWMPDGRELIYASPEGGIARLWRVPADLSREALPLPGIPMPAGEFSIAHPGPPQAVRLAFVTKRNKLSIRRIDLQSAVKGAFSTGAPFSETTRNEWPGAFSPDGTRVVFFSDRAAPGPELWIAGSDGKAARQLTYLRGTGDGACAWSPDGKRIVIRAIVDNNSDLYVVPVDGSSPTRLTSSPAVEGFPEWSRDGHWIYYTVTAGAALPDIWRIPAEGGAAQQVTPNGGFEPKVAPDGQHLYYLDRPPASMGGSQVVSRLMRMPLDGGEAELIYDQVPPSYWSVTEYGVVFLKLVELTPSERKMRQLDLIRVDAVEMYRFADRKIVRLGTLPFRVTSLPGRFVVSRDGRWALASVDAGGESDLMLLDGLR
jgi:Tol biopolymer transport system component